MRHSILIVPTQISIIDLMSEGDDNSTPAGENIAENAVPVEKDTPGSQEMSEIPTTEGIPLIDEGNTNPGPNTTDGALTEVSSSHSHQKKSEEKEEYTYTVEYYSDGETDPEGGKKSTDTKPKDKGEEISSKCCLLL
jgi:hypothetical protein